MVNLLPDEQDHFEQIIQQTPPDTLEAALHIMEEHKASDPDGTLSLNIYRKGWEQSRYSSLGISPHQKIIAFLLLLRLRVTEAYEEQAQSMAWEKISYNLTYGSQWQQQALCNQLHKSALAEMLPPPTNPKNTLQPQGTEWDNLPLSEKVEQAIAFADDMVGINK